MHQNNLSFESKNLVVDYYKVCFKQLKYNPSSKSFWEGTKIKFSIKNAAYCYNLIKEQRFDWIIFELNHHTLSLS